MCRGVSSLTVMSLILIGVSSKTTTRELDAIRPERILSSLFGVISSGTCVEPIISTVSCQSACSEYGYTFVAFLSSPSQPYGCYLNPTNSKVHFNSLASSTVAASASLNLICNTYSGIYTIAEMCSFPAASDAACSLAAAAFGLTYSGSQSLPNYPMFCFHNDQNGVVFNTASPAQCSTSYNCLCARPVADTSDVLKGSSGFCSDFLGYVPVANVALCESIAQRYGYSFAGTLTWYTSLPAGCILQTSSNSIYFNPTAVGGFFYSSSNVVTSFETLYNLCNSRSDYEVSLQQVCSIIPSDSSDCEIAALSLGFEFGNEITSTALPYGCIWSGDDNFVYYNVAVSPVACSSVYVCICRTTCLAGQSLVGNTCTDCAAGYYKAVDGVEACTLCAQGKFQNIAGAETCILCPAGLISSAGASECTDCTPGQYDISGVCVSCPAGTLQETIGSSTCTNCSKGSFSVVGATTCIECAPGQYAPYESMKSCLPCPGGQYCSTTGAIRCTDAPLGTFTSGGSASFKYCSKGSYAQGGASACSNCSVGTISDQTGSTSCSSCAAGKYTDRMGQSKCVFCPQGTFNSQVGLTSSEMCVSCAVGKYAIADHTYCFSCDAGHYAVQSLFICVACSPGRFASQALSDKCDTCETGKFSRESSSTTCTSCASGSFALRNESTECTMCLLGYYQGATAQAECLPCGRGFFSNQLGASTCTACEAGNYSSVISSTSCHRCEVGSSQSATGQSECKSCAAGWYANRQGVVSCDICKLGTTSLAASSQCALAQPGYFIDTLAGKALECPSHSVCVGGLYLPTPVSGYWVDRSSLAHAGYVHKCLMSTCKGVESASDHRRRLDEVSACWKPSGFEDSSGCSERTLQCMQGSFGPLCGSCEPGHYYVSTSRSCASCSKTWFSSVVSALIGMAVALILLAVYTGYLQIPPWVYESWIYGVSVRFDSGACRVCWSTFQILQSTSTSLSIALPGFYTASLNYFPFLSLNFAAILRCIPGNAGYFDTVYIWSALPALVAIVVLAVYGTRMVISNYLNESDRFAALKRELSYTLLSLSYLVLPPIVLNQLQALQCDELAGSDLKYLRFETTVDCSSDIFNRFKVVNSFLIVMYMTIPLLWLKVLRDRSSQLNPLTADVKLAVFLREKDASLDSLRFLFEPYAPRYYYLEVIEMYRRIVFVGILPLVSIRPARYAALGVAISLCSLAFYRESEPFLRSSTNKLSSVAQYVILLTYGAALVISTDISHGIGTVLLGVILIVVNIFVIVFATSNAAGRYYREKHEKTNRMQRRVKHLESALNFSSVKFSTTFETLRSNNVPPSHSLVCWYSSVASAERALRCGIPASSSLGGIIFTLHHAHEIDENDAAVFPCREAMLVITLPTRTLRPLPGKHFSSNLKLLTVELLEALRGTHFVDKDGFVDPQLWFKGVLLIPPDRVLRAYQVEEQISKGNFPQSPDDFAIDPENACVPTSISVRPVVVTSCFQYIEAISEMRQRCSQQNLELVYHYTQPFLGPLIATSGFRMSMVGQGDGGVYFSTCGPASYGIGSDRFEANLISDCFGIERLNEYLGKQKLDLVIVYGIEPAAVSRAPGGRDNALVVSKAMFDSLASAHQDGNYFLRADRILGMFIFDSGSSMSDLELCRDQLQDEKTLDDEKRARLFSIMEHASINERGTVELEYLRRTECRATFGIEILSAPRQRQRRVSSVREALSDFLAHSFLPSHSSSSETILEEAVEFPPTRRLDRAVSSTGLDVVFSGANSRVSSAAESGNPLHRAGRSRDTDIATSIGDHHL